MKTPDKIGRHTPYPGAKQYILHFYKKENAVYIFDPDIEEPMIKYGPINDKSPLDINVIVRKAARYLLSLEKDSAKLRAEGFVFLKAPSWEPPPLKKVAVPKSKPLGYEAWWEAGKGRK